MYDVIVIGAGISGLYATWKLEKRLLNVLLLEKKDRIGGRLKTVERNGKKFDVGGIRYSLTHHKKLVKLCKELSIENREHKIYPSHTKDVSFIRKTLKKISSSFNEEELKSNTIEYFLRKMDSSSTDRFIQSWGYLGNIQNAQAYWFLKSTSSMYNDGRMYYMKSGFGNLIKSLQQQIQSEIKTTCGGVCDIEKDINGGFKIYMEDGTIYHSKKVICALPQEALLKMNYFDKHKTLLSTVTSNNYIRIFGEMETKQRFLSHSGNDLVPQTISRGDGIVQLAYADSKKAEYLRNSYIHGTFPTKEIVEKFQLGPDPKWVESFYWKNGTHYWNPYVDVENTYKSILNPEKDLFIVGEAFSKKQAWIEGALETVDDVLKIIFKRGKHLILPKKRVVRKNAHWIIYRGVKYDVTEYEENHPGGNVIKVGRGKDITKMFDGVPHSEFARNILMNLPILDDSST